MKNFKVKIIVNALYSADDKDDCEHLVFNDFPKLECNDKVEIQEVRPR